jgi:glycosyltransferase involved in cell wall biosynthesis
VVDGENGILVDPGDATAIRNAILEMRDASLRKRFGLANRQKIERDYAWSRVAERYLEHYRAAVSSADED